MTLAVGQAGRSRASPKAVGTFQLCAPLSASAAVSTCTTQPDVTSAP